LLPLYRKKLFARLDRAAPVGVRTAPNKCSALVPHNAAVTAIGSASSDRTSAELAKVATFYKPIRLGAISASLFPDSLTDTKGTFRKPAPW